MTTNFLQVCTDDWHMPHCGHYKLEWGETNTMKEKCKACDGDGESRDAHFAAQPCEACGGSGLVKSANL